MTAKSPTPSALRQWPIQLMLLPETSPFFQGADLLVCADCVPFAYAEFHRDFLTDRSLVVGCPKLDDVEFYTEKLKRMAANSGVRSIAVVRMEVPCCYGLTHAVRTAVAEANPDLPVEEIVIGVDGEVRLQGEGPRMGCGGR